MTVGRCRWLLVAAAATAVFVLSALAARDRTVSTIEGDLFHAFNAAPSWLYPPLWLVMQFGNIIVACATAIVVGALLRRWQVALGGALACVAAWCVAKAVKTVVARGRPEVFFGDVRFPGIHEGDFGFISGHSTVAFALATVLAAAIPTRARWVPFAVAIVVAIARLYVGVHLPLDVLGGAAAGVAIGSLTNVVLGPSSR